MNPWRDVLRPLVLLTGVLLRRLAREGLVVRSLVFPVALTVAALFATIGVVIAFQAPGVVAVGPDARVLEPAFAAAGLVPAEVDDPEAAVRDRVAPIGTDGRTLWMRGEGHEARVAERVLREHVGASWVPEPDVNRPRGVVATSYGATLSTLMAGVFALYGVVFGAGMVTRDREDGTLEAERSLPVPAFVHGAARWLAGTVCLAAFLTLSLFVFDALIGLADLGALLRNAVAGSAAATALGLVSVRRESAQGGFGGSLALGLTGTTALMGTGLAAPSIARYLPLASIPAGGSGWSPLLLSIALGIVAAVIFDRQVRA